MATIQIADNDARVQYTQAVTANTTQLTIDFPFFDLDDINVIVTTAAGVDTTLSRGTGTGTFAVTGTSVEDGYSGGYITLGDSYSAGTDTFTIFRDIPITRTTDFPTSGPFNVASLNTELDKLTAIAQQNETSVSRTLQLSDSDATVDLKLPNLNTRKGKTLAFNTTTGVPEAGPSISDVQTISAAAADIATLADIEDGTEATDAISTVAGISSDVSTVSGISANVTTVSGISADVTAVAADATDIGTVATNIASVNTVATNISDVIAVANDLNEAVSEVETVANDLNEAVSEIETVAASITNVDTVGTNIASVNTNATNISSINTNATNITDIQNASANAASALASKNAAATSETNAATSETNAASSASSASTSASSASSSASSASTSAATATTQAGIATTKAGEAATSETNAATSATNAASSATSAASSASSASSAQTAAESARDATLAAYDNFDDRYLGAKSSAPTLDNDGNALVAGALYFDTVAEAMYVYTGSSWVAAYVSGTGFLALTGGTMTGTITFAGAQTFDGRDVSADGAKLDGIESGATADQTKTDIDALGIDAATLDSLDSTQFLRSDAADTKTSGDLSFADGVKATFGAGSDLQIYHDGSNSYIHDYGTGSLYIDATHLNLRNAAQTATYADFTNGGGARLMHNGNVKFETVGGGVQVTGYVQADSLYLGDNERAYFGVGNDLQIYHDGSSSYISDEGTGDLNIRASDDLRLQVQSGGSWINSVICNDAAAVDIYYNNALKFSTTSSGCSVTGTLEATTVDLGNWTITESAGVLYFATGGTNKMKIDASGNLTVVGDVTAYGTV